MNRDKIQYQNGLILPLAAMSYKISGPKPEQGYKVNFILMSPMIKWQGSENVGDYCTITDSNTIIFRNTTDNASVARPRYCSNGVFDVTDYTQMVYKVKLHPLAYSHFIARSDGTNRWWLLGLVRNPGSGTYDPDIGIRGDWNGFGKVEPEIPAFIVEETFDISNFTGNYHIYLAGGEYEVEILSITLK